MASLQKRKQLVNQLRSAHFPFGFESNKNAASQYVEKYREYQIQLQEQNKNARKTNFDIKTVDYNNDYVSEFKEKFPQHPLQPKNKQGANNLEANVVFGYDGNSYNTNYNSDFEKKNNENERVKPINQRQPHIDFGDSLTDFATTYNQVYNPKELPKKIANTTEMRKSNMILGNDSNNFVTQHNAAYKPVSNPNYHLQKRQNINNITLGTDKPNFSSEHSSHFAHKEAPRNVVDFKSAHFQFGFPQKPLQNFSQAQAQYNQKPIDYHLAQGNRASSIDLNVDGKNYFNSSYTKDYPLKSGEKTNPIKTGEIHNVLLGTDKDPNHYVSEAKQQFKQKAPLHDQPKKFKHPNSLDLGNLPNNYQTHYQDIHTNKFPQREDCRLTDEQIRKLKDKNFETGFNGPNFGISSASYGSKLGPTNKLSKQVLDGMKNTNIVQGDDTNPFKGNSIYKSSFPWKNNDEF